MVQSDQHVTLNKVYQALDRLQGEETYKHYVKQFLAQQQDQIQSLQTQIGEYRDRLGLIAADKKSILCIEDNEENAELIKTIVEKAGYTAYVAHTV